MSLRIWVMVDGLAAAEDSSLRIAPSCCAGAGGWIWLPVWLHPGPVAPAGGGLFVGGTTMI